MISETTGVVISVKKQWWFKVNTKALRRHAFDGAIFPHIIKVKYNVNGKDYIKGKWINAGFSVPQVNSFVTVAYSEDSPKKAKIL